jgi:2-iminobutanoate/2-iminopropanoate deaminase
MNWLRWLICASLASSVFTGCAPEQRDREIISTSAAPAAIGPYSQAIRVGNTVYAAGQIGLDPQTGQLVEGGVGPQTERALLNLKAVLSAAGFTLADAVQVSVYLADLDDYAAMNEIYARFFGESVPARAAVEVSRLPREARVEISLIASRKDGG